MLKISSFAEIVRPAITRKDTKTWTLLSCRECPRHGNFRMCCCRFQLVGIACLRAAMGDTVRRLPVRLTDQDINLDAQRFAYISDRTYTPEEVESMTQTVASTTPEHVKDAPNAKMFLRSLWYRAIMSTLLSSDEMHVYTVAR